MDYVKHTVTDTNLTKYDEEYVLHHPNPPLTVGETVYFIYGGCALAVLAVVDDDYVIAGWIEDGQPREIKLYVQLCSRVPLNLDLD